MKILLTGGSGFIGKYLTPELSQHEVYHLKSDLRDYDAVREEVLAFQPNVTVHLAARTEVESSFYEQVTFSEINYVGSVNLIEACKDIDDFQLFLFASTMETYGWQPVSDLVRDNDYIKPAEAFAFNEDTPLNPNAPYAVAKVAVEKYLEYATRAYGLPWCAIRTTNCYGRWDNAFFVTESIISQMARKDECNLGYSEPYRNFIFIDDLIYLYTRLINNPHAASALKAFTCGPNNPIKMRDYAELIAKKMDFTGTINWDTRPHRPGEIFYLSSTNDKVNVVLDWKPRVELEEGLDKTIKLWIT
jgi:nucleoside-diphosphate-sugar epimerase